MIVDVDVDIDVATAPRPRGDVHLLSSAAR